MQARDSLFALGLVVIHSVFFTTGCGKESTTNDALREGIAAKITGFC